MKQRNRRPAKLLAGILFIVGGVSCSGLNRTGPSVTCADLNDGAKNACQEGIIASCKGGSVTYEVCTAGNTPEQVCGETWQTSGAFKCTQSSTGGGGTGAGPKQSGPGSTTAPGADATAQPLSQWSAVNGQDVCAPKPSQCKIVFGDAACDSCSHDAAHSSECSAIGRCASDINCCQAIDCYTTNCVGVGENAKVKECLQTHCPKFGNTAFGELTDMLIRNNAGCPCNW